jgi:hypothetical protein
LNWFAATLFESGFHALVDAEQRTSDDIGEIEAKSDRDDEDDQYLYSNDAIWMESVFFEMVTATYGELSEHLGDQHTDRTESDRIKNNRQLDSGQDK